MRPKEEIVEKKMGIAPDYQYRAMRNSFWAKKNWHKNKFEIIKTICKFTHNEDVLDLGTGSGNFELLFSQSVKQIYGIDYNDDALCFLKNALKKRNIGNVKLICADMRKLPKELDNKKFDLILSIDTIEHVTRKDGEKIIAWSEKRLKKNGRLVIVTPNYGSAWSSLESLLDILSFTPNMGAHQHLSNYSVSSMSKLLTSNKFELKNVMTFNLFSFLFPKYICEYFLKFETKILKDRGCLMAIEAVKR
jgi:ubiquinone/menaquinone biosynthesis C-methylase UbiE